MRIVNRPSCDASLVHAHGNTRCWLRVEHEGKHEGPCDQCFEFDIEAVLEWTARHEVWG